MSRQMLIDAAHPEETRVVTLNNNRLEEFDLESANKKQLKGNIYLAKVTRVEPSLQAAFVDYGGNRHGFLPFSEIHPDYYRIPIADREALIAEEAALRRDDNDQEANDDTEESGKRARGRRRGGRGRRAKASNRTVKTAGPAPEDGDPADGAPVEAELDAGETDEAPDREPGNEAPETASDDAWADDRDTAEDAAEAEAEDAAETPADEKPKARRRAATGRDEDVEEVEAETKVDTVGGDEAEEDAKRRARLMRRYKIQEVIKRRQVLLVQVTKEERGNKGAALTTYLSLAGRYCVLMPNTNKGGGISRKIANATDRRKLKKIVSELSIPEGMAVIVRTAGSQRTKPEIRRDYEYLLRLWNEIRENTMESMAPSPIHEEANLMTRAIRDLYTREMDEVLVAGDEGYKSAKAFMKSLMPSHARKVKLYKDPALPLFQKFRVENQLDAMHSSTVQLRSGGYIVINPTEALVAIDVNSGRATRERHIEETALRTNLEAAEEVARQLRLRDLAGLIVIDFIDMEESRHNRAVERKLKEAMRNDRARIQLGGISPFGLLELSRQRLRPSLQESSTVACPRCAGSGRLRSVDSTALHVLRMLEEEGVRRPGGRVRLAVPTEVALHILNRNRARLVEIEQRYEFTVEVERDDDLIPPDHELRHMAERRDSDDDDETGAPRARPRSRDRDRDRDDDGRKRRRKRHGKGREESGGEEAEAESPGETGAAPESGEDARAAPAAGDEDDGDDEGRKSRRRRGKRGGRRRSRRREAGEIAARDSGEPGRTEASDGEESADAVSDTTVADSAEEAPTQASKAGDAETAEERPGEARPRRRGRRKTADGAPAEKERTAARKRAPRGRKSAATVKTDEEAASVQPIAEAADAPVNGPPAPSGPAPRPTPSAETPAAGAGEDKPKRRGWWNRLIS